MSVSARERVEVAVIGGGPAGAVTAALLAGLGHEVVVLERAPRWRWRPCGVFAGPAAMAALRRIGVPEMELARVAQPVPAIRVETPRGASFRLTYDGSGALADAAVGFDREALDDLLLERARAAGAEIRLGARADRVEFAAGGAAAGSGAPGAAGALAGGPLIAGERPAGTPFELRASIVIGADGLRSVVARDAGVARRPPFERRTAMTFHVRRAAVPPSGDSNAADARMVVLRDGYVGLAPVPGDRLNVGIVLGPSCSNRMQGGPAGIAAEILASVGGRAGPTHVDPAEPPSTDRLVGVRPVSAAVSRRAGATWALVGDAAGFLDPFTGEGIHRALVSAELAAATAHDVLAHRAGVTLADYDAAMRERFASKDAVSRLVQGFLGRPVLFEYAARRLQRRATVRAAMGRVLGDLVPASRALDPRFLARLLAP